ncbi:MAG: MerR family transcriptional regulator [Candidatus Omnitrophica bacterium]|jgi:DNA-binding transcriptional MerR regulator|nr:MerR family transcriptional regulator [Candidatus Omnitrophota bacterium]
MEKRYNLSEAAKELGLTRQGLYYWIKKGWATPKRDYKGYPVFTEIDLKKIKEWRDKLENF